MNMLRVGGGAEILFMCSGALKNRWGKGEGIKSGYSKGLITWAGLACFAEIPAPLLNASKLDFAIIWQPS